MGGVADIARHFGLKAIYVLAAWGVTRIFRAGRRHLLRQRSRAPDHEAQGLEPPAAEPAVQPRSVPRIKVYHKPLVDFKPSNPRWLTEAASLDPAALATDLSWQCPLLIEFQAKVAGQGRAWQQPSPQSPGQPRPAPAPAPAPAPGPAPGSTGPASGLPVAFGRPARKQLFTLDPDFTYLNHGSYGAAFRLALEVQCWYQQLLEAQPVRFMETVALKGLVSAAADAARFVGACPADVVPVVNATSAINAVLDSLPLRRGDWVLMLNTTYPAVKNTLARVAAAAGASILEVQLGLEELLRPASIVAAVQAALGAVGGGRRVKLAVLDHVVSFPPVVLPVSELVAVCKQVGARVLVDGAHAVGNVPQLQVPALGADFYTTNLHKWGCSPKGAALLWAAPEQQPALHPVITSHGYRLGFRGEFLWQGTTDPSAWLAVPAALAVLRALGPERVALHNATLVSEAAAALRRRWQTPGRVQGQGQRHGPGHEHIPDRVGQQAGSGPAAASALSGRGAAVGAERAGGGGGAVGGDGGGEVNGGEASGGGGEAELLQLGGGGDWQGGGAAGMLAVQLPQLWEYECTADDAVRLQRWLRNEKSIEVPVVSVFGRLWVRISAQIYNEMADYDKLGEAIAGLRR